MRVLFDTSVVIDPAGVEIADDATCAISTITVAELGVGVATARDEAERVRRTIGLQRIRSLFEELPVDSAVAEAYAAVAVAVRAEGRNHRPRALDMLIAATALAHDVPLVTRDVKDFMTLHHLIDIRSVA